MSWRDKVQTMREGENYQICVSPSLPKPPKPSSVSFGSTPPSPFQEKTGFSSQPVSNAAVLKSLQKPDIGVTANDPAQAVRLVANTPEATGTSASIEPPTDPNAWRELATAYHRHHFKCSTCIAAGRGAQYGLRCGVGAALWASYQYPKETT